MAKRKRKSERSRRSRGNPRNYSQLYKDDKTVAPAPSAPAQPTATPAAATATPAADSTATWNDEYGYVFNDLKLLGIVSAVIFALMLGAGFIFG